MTNTKYSKGILIGIMSFFVAILLVSSVGMLREDIYEFTECKKHFQELGYNNIKQCMDETEYTGWELKP